MKGLRREGVLVVGKRDNVFGVEGIRIGGSYAFGVDRYFEMLLAGGGGGGLGSSGSAGGA